MALKARWHFAAVKDGFSPLDRVVTGETGVREGVQTEHWLFVV